MNRKKKTCKNTRMYTGMEVKENHVVEEKIRKSKTKE